MKKKMFTVEGVVKHLKAKKFGKGFCVQQGNMSIRESAMVDFLKRNTSVFFATPEVFGRI